MRLALLGRSNFQTMNNKEMMMYVPRIKYIKNFKRRLSITIFVNLSLRIVIIIESSIFRKRILITNCCAIVII